MKPRTETLKQKLARHAQESHDELVNGLIDRVIQGRDDAAIAAWRVATQADRELGGDAWNETLSLAGSVMKEFGTPAMREALNIHGIGDHPELIRLITRLGRALNDARTNAAAGVEGARDRCMMTALTYVKAVPDPTPEELRAVSQRKLGHIEGEKFAARAIAVAIKTGV